MSLVTPLHFRSLFQAKIADHIVTPSATEDVILLVGRTKHSIFIQLIVVDVTTNDLVKWTFQDTASPALIIGSLGPGPGTGQFVVVDYGPQGRPVTEGVFINGETNDNEVFVTIMGYYAPVPED